MRWVKSLRGKTVGLDAAPLIFHIEDHPTYADLTDAFSMRYADFVSALQAFGRSRDT